MERWGQVGKVSIISSRLPILQVTETHLSPLSQTETETRKQKAQVALHRAGQGREEKGSRKTASSMERGIVLL